jgi:hypothetical protein
MPKINKETITTYKSYPTLKIFKYQNSGVFHFVMYVGTKIDRIDNTRVISGNFGHSLKTKILRDAEQSAKLIYKSAMSKIETGEITKVEFDFDKDIVGGYFNTRQKLYTMRERNISNLKKEKSQYYNYCSQFFTNIDYQNETIMNDSIMDLVNFLKSVEITPGNRMRDTTITKYMNIISQICKYGQKKGLMKSIPDIPTFKRINAEVFPYFPKELKMIRTELNEYYKRTEDKIYLYVIQYIAFLQGLKINRAGLNALNVRKSQFEEVSNHESILPIIRVTLFNTKNNPRIKDVCEPWWVDKHYFTEVKHLQFDDYIFAPEVTKRTQLYDKLRKTFVRVSSELNLYMKNGSSRPFTSIRHLNALKIYERTQNIDAVAQGINTDPKLVKSNYLNYSDEWSRTRYKEMGYDKDKKYNLPQSSMKSKNNKNDK